jgi:hypothetical protein
MSSEIQSQECCPRFDPTPWDGKVFEWKNKKFIKDSVPTQFYMPLNFGEVITRMTEKVAKYGAEIPDWLCLSDHTSESNMDLYLAVDKEVKDAKNVTLSGKFLSKVYEGNFENTGEWCRDFEDYAKNAHVIRRISCAFFK